MESSLDRFNDTPELIYMIASHLSRKDISAFRLTCHKFLYISRHFFYRNVRLTDRWTREGLQMLAKSARFVCSFESSERACTHYYSSISNSLRNSARLTPFDQITSTIHASSPRTSHQLTNPAELIDVLSYSTLHALCTMNCFPAKLLYVISISPRLTILDLGPLKIYTDFDLRIFSRTLSSINTLRSLSLSIHTEHLSAEDVLKALVHNSPSFLEFFSLFLEAEDSPVALGAADLDDESALSNTEDLSGGKDYLLDAEGSNDEFAHLSDTVSALLGPITGRKEPLGKLTDWRLITNRIDIDVEVFISVLKFLPELTSMDVPSIGFQAPVHTFDAAIRISKACPKLRNLSKRHIHTDKEGTMVMALLHNIPINTVESLQIARLTEDVRTFGDALDFHKESIKSIVFDECRWIAAESLVSIFFQSSVLEVFRISMYRGSMFKVLLEDLVRQQWASNKFKDLKLYLQFVDNRHDAEQPAELDTTDSTPNWAIDLERFYRQIGALTQLRTLDLRIAASMYTQDKNGKDIMYYDKTFVGMLTLEDRSAGRVGWLQLLGGLKSLEELHGSFNIDAMQEHFEFGQREADWIVEHWPKLKFIEFYTLSEETSFSVSVPVQSMKAKLPGLEVGKAYSIRHFL
ncbi:hypothetical protein BGX24_003783 [Mortierella sp. AD032]|nr:hypothetical protein BGX24_003783 [Mortierella sp. AD032]